MKYGLLLYKETSNIGDDVQAYASSQFLPQVDMIIDRERLDDTRSDEPVAVIMNGWFLHKKWNWPPADCIRPLMVAFHYSDYENAMYYGHYIKEVFLQGLGLDYLKKVGPIGCRDTSTLELLKRLGVESYFSGCMTLTLPQMPRREVKEPYVCLVDMNVTVTQKLTQEAEKQGLKARVMTHLIEPYAEGTPWEERAAKVEELLTTYQNATCVVTSRLHCALPCLALGVPVLLVRPDMKNNRFIPFVDWLHTATYRDVVEGRLNYSLSNPPANNGGHIPVRNELIRRAKEFVAAGDDLPQLYKASNEERLQWQNTVMKQVLHENLRHYKEDLAAMQKKGFEDVKGHEIGKVRRVIRSLKVNGLKLTIMKIKRHFNKL